MVIIVFVLMMMIKFPITIAVINRLISAIIN